MEPFSVTLFHLKLRSPLPVGKRVAVGQELGTSKKLSGTAGEIAIEVLTNRGMKLVSFFDAMNDAVFAEYRARGVISRNATIISRMQRNRDPLRCDGDSFTYTGTIKNLLDLN